MPTRLRFVAIPCFLACAIPALAVEKPSGKKAPVAEAADTGELAEVVRDRDRVIADRDRIIAERDKVIRERDEAVAARAALEKEVRQLRRKVAALEGKRAEK